MLDNDLSMFTGTENWTRHQFGALLFTDGINYLRNKDENGVVDCFWLVDAIASHQSDALDKKCDGFQSWSLTAAPTKAMPKRALLECRVDSGRPAIISQEIPYTDFPFDQIRGEPLQLWVEGVGRPPAKGISGRVLLLPSEH